MAAAHLRAPAAISFEAGFTPPTCSRWPQLRAEAVAAVVRKKRGTAYCCKLCSTWHTAPTRPPRGTADPAFPTLIMPTRKRTKP